MQLILHGMQNVRPGSVVQLVLGMQEPLKSTSPNSVWIRGLALEPFECAQVWLLLILMVISPDICELWEAVEHRLHCILCFLYLFAMLLPDSALCL